MRLSRAALALLVPAAGSAVVLATAVPAFAVVRPVSAPTVAVRFPLGVGDSPENVVDAGNGYVDATLNQAGRVIRVAPDGTVSTLAQLPTGARAMGITRTPQGVLYVSVGGNDPALQGIWRIQPGAPTRVAALPAPGFPNGLSSAADGTLYVADSSAGVLYRLAPGATTVTPWFSAPVIAPIARLGVNGVKVHHDALGDAVYVSDTDAGTLVRITINSDGTPGAGVVRAKGITGFDDFTFVPGTDTVLAAGNSADAVSLVSPAGHVYPVLARSDGLAGPTSISVSGTTVTVMNADYGRGTDPSVLRATLAPLPADTRH